MRKLVVSFGDGKPLPRNAQLARIVRVEHMEWAEVAALFTKDPPRTDDKASAGWYSFAEYDPVYRDSDNLVARHALTLDYDHITLEDVKKIMAAYAPVEHVMYTTASHTTEKPRLRVIMPLSRPAGYDEFQAVSRRVASWAGIELASRETHVPAQMMFLPTARDGAPFKARHNANGTWIDVDTVLGEYDDWTDRTQWPKRKEGDGVHSGEGSQTPPDEKPGIVGDFCRALDVYQAIERFHLPYVPTTTEGRLTYTAGSRPEGALVYDDGLKLHSHHDTDPARGQNNAFDLVRLHKFSALDSDDDKALPVTQRPSYRAMCELAMQQAEVRQQLVENEFEDLGELTEEEQLPADRTKAGEALAKRISDVLRTPTHPRWLIPDYIERGVVALMVGERGSYKSFISLDWAARIAKSLDPESKEAVYVISAEGGDYDRRFRAWWKAYGDDRPVESIPLYVVERRLNLNTKEGIDLIRNDCLRLGVRPVLFVLDTFSKLSAGLDENDNSQVKSFIGRLDNGFKRKETGFDATVLVVAHTGHGDKTRARGASALGADTDAEYIVQRDERNNNVKLTRERFKSSPELPPISYKPEVIDLAYVDDRGRPVSSVVMREEVAVEAAPIREPRGTNKVRVWEVVQELCRGGVEARVSAILEKTAERMVQPEEGKRDRRQELARVALNALCDEGFVYLTTGGSKVALTRATAVPEEEFDENDYLQ
jgi:hypothetical protein